MLSGAPMPHAQVPQPAGRASVCSKQYRMDLDVNFVLQRIP